MARARHEIREHRRREAEGSLESLKGWQLAEGLATLLRLIGNGINFSGADAIVCRANEKVRLLIGECEQDPLRWQLIWQNLRLLFDKHCPGHLWPQQEIPIEGDDHLAQRFREDGAAYMREIDGRYGR